MGFTLSICSLQAHTCVSKSVLFNWKHFSILYLLTHTLPSFFMFDKIYMTYDFQKSLFSENISFVAPSQFPVYMHVTPTCIHKVF